MRLIFYFFLKSGGAFKPEVKACTALPSSGVPDVAEGRCVSKRALISASLIEVWLIEVEDSGRSVGVDIDESRKRKSLKLESTGILFKFEF